MNFDTDVNEHQDNIKQTIQKLQTSQLFDKSIVKDLHLFFFYVINQKLETFKRIDLTINDSLLTKNELLSNILKNKKEDGRKFNITGIYKYHFNETDLSDFVDNNTLSKWFTSLSKVDDVPYEKSIEIFQDYTSLFIILQNEKSIKTKRQTDQKKNKTIRKC
jgi:hypothetical protein|tara:strand:+ start:680 stop:1165 length:486 start_codon:yes stop_codon:yes gene_type:complete